MFKILMDKLTEPFEIPINDAQGFQILHILIVAILTQDKIAFLCLFEVKLVMDMPWPMKSMSLAGRSCKNQRAPSPFFFLCLSD